MNPKPPKDPSNPDRQRGGTPRALFDQWHLEYSFTVDICADETNHKLERYVTKTRNGLCPGWWFGERVWCNPPYNNITPWLSLHDCAEFAAYLLPVRTDRFWWMRFKPKAECHYLVRERPHSRLQFEAPPGITYSSNTAANCLLLFGEGTVPGGEVWRSGTIGERLS